LIIYRKTHGLRFRRTASPQPPFWCATTVAPYGGRRGQPISVDYIELVATFAEKLEVNVAENVRTELERAPARLHGPVFIEASEFAEQIFRRGEETLLSCRDLELEATILVSTRGALPHVNVPGTTTVIAAWPLEFPRLEALCAEAASRGLRWGLAIPVIFPVTTNLEALDQLALMAATHRASFLAAVPVELDATAKRSMAQSLALEDDDDAYAMLFHSDLEPIHTSTERHIAALAAAIAVSDFVVPPRWSTRSNWNAAVLLTLTAGRMIAMSRDVELAGALARSARTVAELDKPIERIGQAASLGIIEALDAASVDILTDWLESGRSSFIDRINEEWRLRRDYRG
jgi:hypothetical protein